MSQSAAALKWHYRSLSPRLFSLLTPKLSLGEFNYSVWYCVCVRVYVFRTEEYLWLSHANEDEKGSQVK